MRSINVRAPRPAAQPVFDSFGFFVLSHRHSHRSARVLLKTKTKSEERDNGDKFSFSQKSQNPARPRPGRGARDAGRDGERTERARTRERDSSQVPRTYRRVGWREPLALRCPLAQSLLCIRLQNRPHPRRDVKRRVGGNAPANGIYDMEAIPAGPRKNPRKTLEPRFPVSAKRRPAWLRS